MEQTKKDTSAFALEPIITTALKLPGVKVNRCGFLSETFSGEGADLHTILDVGPIQAGISRERLGKIASKLIVTRTSQSSLASFVAGIPGGLAMAAAIPADIAQFFGMALRLAQELSYLYGGSDLWEGNQIDDERVKNQLILYCGVMFGVSGAVSGVRVLSTQIAKTTLKKLPQKALTKTFWYPIIKQIGKAIGLKVTKTTVAKGVSKAVPIVGGLISGGLNYASMMPMANRLNATLDKACFDYSDEEMNEDILVLENIDEQSAEPVPQSGIAQFADNSINAVQEGWKKATTGVTSLFGKKKAEPPKSVEEPVVSYDEKIETVRKLKQLVDEGILTQEEFDAKRKELLDL